MLKSIMDYFKSLSQRKWVKGLELSIASAIATGIYTSLNSGHLPATGDEWKQIGILGISAGITYVIHPKSGDENALPNIPKTDNSPPIVKG